MVSLSQVVASNAAISSKFPPGLVGVFVGATSGIGEITLKTFAKYANKPCAYFVGRSQEDADRIEAECRLINPKGEYHFIKKDISLIRGVDEVCQEIKRKEKIINILFLSAGLVSLDGSLTVEGVHLISALTHYSRVRFMTNLLPLIRKAPHLRRVVTVGGAGREGAIDITDIPALHLPTFKLRPHLITLLSLGLEAVAKTAPEVSFIHDYPGTVKTSLLSRGNGGGIARFILGWYIWLFGRWICVPIEESGERHLYLATSEIFPPAKSGDDLVRLEDRNEAAVGMNGETGGGVYSVGWDCESSSRKVLELLATLREAGVVEQIWDHTEGEFRRIVRSGNNC